MPVLMSVALHEKKIHVTLNFNCLYLRNAMQALIMPLTWGNTDASASGIKWPKSYVAPHFNCIGLRNVLVTFVMPIPVLMLHLIWISWISKCIGTIDDAFDITWYSCMCEWHHMTKKLWCFSFDHLCLTNGMMSLTTLLAWCDTNTSINGITWPKMLCCTSFWLSHPSKFSGTIDNAIDITWCWYQWHHMTKRIMLHWLLII